MPKNANFHQKLAYLLGKIYLRFVTGQRFSTYYASID